jgi:hypothetical protein
MYQTIFCENAKEYKQVPQLADDETVKDTKYAEVLRLIALFLKQEFLLNLIINLLAIAA